MSGNGGQRPPDPGFEFVTGTVAGVVAVDIENTPLPGLNAGPQARTISSRASVPMLSPMMMCSAETPAKPTTATMDSITVQIKNV